MRPTTSGQFVWMPRSARTDTILSPLENDFMNVGSLELMPHIQQHAIWSSDIIRQSRKAYSMRLRKMPQPLAASVFSCVKTGILIIFERKELRCFFRTVGEIVSGRMGSECILSPSLASRLGRSECLRERFPQCERGKPFLFQSERHSNDLCIACRVGHTTLFIAHR